MRRVVITGRGALSPLGHDWASVHAHLRSGRNAVRRFDEYAGWLDAAEGSGFDLLTCGDSQSLWADCPAVERWFGRVRARPAYAQAFYPGSLFTLREIREMVG